MKAVVLAVLMVTAAASPWAKQAPDPVEAEPVAIVEESIEEEAVGAEPEEETWDHSAVCVITHFCNCSKCCGKWAGGPTASGVMPTAGRTVAVDKKVIPLGSEVLINGIVYIAEDTGVSGYHIDIYCDSHQEALRRGMYKTEVSWR